MITVNVSGLKETQAYLAALASGDLRFGIAKGLTSLANGIREKVMQELPGKFTLRTTWWNRGPYSIKTVMANKRTLTASVFTTAPWMQLQESGGTKQASGKRLAMPMLEVKRTKRDLIRANQKPKALQKAFHIKTKSGLEILAVRTGRGKNSQLRLMYMLKRSATIKQRFGFHETAQRVVDQVGLTHISEGIKYALETSKR
jgi:hypothetical protein